MGVCRARLAATTGLPERLKALARRATREKIRTLQRALYVKAKREPTRRFHFLYDKVWREDILAHAYACCRANGGAPGVDGETFSRIEAYGVERWLDELREEVRGKIRWKQSESRPAHC